MASKASQQRVPVTHTDDDDDDDGTTVASQSSYSGDDSNDDGDDDEDPLQAYYSNVVGRHGRDANTAVQQSDLAPPVAVAVAAAAAVPKKMAKRAPPPPDADVFYTYIETRYAPKLKPGAPPSKQCPGSKTLQRFMRCYRNANGKTISQWCSREEVEKSGKQATLHVNSSNRNNTNNEGVVRADWPEALKEQQQHDPILGFLTRTVQCQSGASRQMTQAISQSGKLYTSSMKAVNAMKQLPVDQQVPHVFDESEAVARWPHVKVFRKSAAVIASLCSAASTTSAAADDARDNDNDDWPTQEDGNSDSEPLPPPTPPTNRKTTSSTATKAANRLALQMNSMTVQPSPPMSLPVTTESTAARLKRPKSTAASTKRRVTVSTDATVNIDDKGRGDTVDSSTKTDNRRRTVAPTIMSRMQTAEQLSTQYAITVHK